MKFLILLVVVGLAISAEARIGHECTEQSQCDDGECCQILSNFPIISKRQLEDVPNLFGKGGTCQRYKTENEHCSLFEQPNGYCGCGPSLTCRGVEVKLNERDQLDREQRKVIARPGYTWVFTCEK